MRVATVLMLLLLAAGCAGGSPKRGGKVAAVPYLSAIQAVPAPMRAAGSGTPFVGLVISGTITNGGSAPLHCSPSAFVLVRGGDNDVAPSAQYCAMQSIAPRQSTFFNATFAAAPRDDWQLRFEHGDGSYEVHDLAVPPG